MALVDIIRSGVATANGVTSSLQPEVKHAAWTSQDGYGKAKYGRWKNTVFIDGYDPLSADLYSVRNAIVEIEQKSREVNGRIVSTYAHLTFLTPFEGPVVPGGSLRKNPVDSRDIFVLPDGTSGPVVDIKGFVDAGTSAPFFIEVWLGALSERGTLL